MDESGQQAAASLPSRYDAALASEIELRWQERWAAEGTFESANPAGPLSAGFVPGRPKRYVLDMFPYASGSGIHVGHPIGYIATDVYARFLRMTGHHVLHAMGYDAFGLPAEQYALSTGRHPQATTRQNVATMRRQLRRLGMGYDSRRSIETTDPRFYRWTQWIFLQIYNSWVDEHTGRARPITDLTTQFASGQRPVPGGRAWPALSSSEQRALIDGRRLAEPLVLMVAPLAPHIAEELWARLGHSESLAYAQFPVADPELARAATVTIPVQVNGRTRYRIEAPAGATEGELQAMVTAHPDFGAHVPDGAARLVIVPDRIVNIIVS